MSKKTLLSNQAAFQSSLIKICRVHFVFVGLYAVYTIASDATHLITPQLVLQRWYINAFLLTAVATVWILAKRSDKTLNYYRSLVYLVVASDIIVATFNVYTQRGMAARAVMLFSLPIVVSAILLSRSALFLTATICTVAYSLAAVKYFVDFFNEGYKAELYIEVGLYCAMFFVLATVLNIFVKAKTN